MNETRLRWQGRIGSLRGLAGLALIFIVIVAVIAIGNLSTALSNPAEPQAVAIANLVDGSLSTDQYVTTSGYALFEAGYEETEDGRVVATYFLLLDEDTGHLVVVKAADALVTGRLEGSLTVTGMTRSSPTDLANLIRSDVVSFEEVGFVTDPTLYLHENQKPPTVTGAASTLVVLVLAGLACLIPFAFPSTVFHPRPADPYAASASGETKQEGVKATGRFQQIKRLEPSIEVGKGTRKFTDAVANIIPQAQGRLLIYIHHVVRTRLFGVVTVGKQENDWGLFITGDQVLSIEPGKLYGWQDRWAVRIRYTGHKSKPETAFASFDSAGAQARFVQLLKQMGFAVTEEPTMESTR